MKFLSELNDDELLIIERKHYDPIIMDKIEFMKSHYFLDDEDIKVSLAKETYVNFDLYYALECIEDDMHEDWLSNVMYSIPVEVRERIEKEINGYLEKEPTYYHGEEVFWRENICRIGTFKKYKGYAGTIEYDSEDKIHYGKVLFTNENHLVNYEAENIVELEEEFHKAVDDYLEFCKEIDLKAE